MTNILIGITVFLLAGTAWMRHLLGKEFSPGAAVLASGALWFGC